MLTDVPWWIDRLAEAAVGQAKLSDGGGRHTAANRIHGDDDALTECTCRHPHHEGAPCPHLNDDGFRDCGCETYVANVRKLRSRALSDGGVNTRASRLLDRVTNSLTTIVRDLCETRGVVPEIGRNGVPSNADGRESHSGSFPGGLAGQAALWLAQHVSAIAASEGAGQTFLEIRRFMGDERHDGEIGKVINRPIPMRTLGKCPTWIEEKRMACGVELSCRQGDVEVYCRGCRHTHNPDRLQLLLMKDLERKKIAFDKILKANRIQPEEYQVPERTLRWWRQESKLKPRGYRRPDGREVITRHSDDDVPLYLWDDVRKLRTEKPERKAKADDCSWCHSPCAIDGWKEPLT